MNLHRHDEITRRRLLANIARTSLGVTLAPMLGSSVATAADFVPHRGKAAKNVIFLWMSGGMSHLDTFDMMNKKASVLGKTKGIDTSVPGLQIADSLPKTAKHMHRVALFNGMNTTQGAHEQGQYLMQRNYNMRGTIVHPAMGSWVVRLAGKRNPNLPGFVSVGGAVSGGFMGGKYGSVPIGSAGEGLTDSLRPDSVTEEDFETRLKLADALNKQFHTQFNNVGIREHESVYQDALKLMKCEDLKAFDISQEPTEISSLYGGSQFGKGCLLARRLVEHGVRFVQVRHGSWDTHYDNFTAVPARCKPLDDGLSGLLTDLNRRGMLEETLVVVATEFGRTPGIVEEHQGGRDHFPRAFTCLMAGGGINGGSIYGKKDDRGGNVIEGLTTPQDFNATIAYALGLPLDQVVVSPSQRPFTIADKGKPVVSLFS